MTPSQTDATLAHSQHPASMQTTWQSFAATSIGKAHIDANLPNQDNFYIQHQGHLSVAVVCDGAGSAKHSEVGSQFFSQAIGEFLLQHADALMIDAQADSLIKVQLTQIRQTLASQIASGSDLRDYYTTVTAVLLSSQTHRALVIQVGDSPLIHSQFIPIASQVDYFHQVTLLGDDSKTEYVNETHFITQDNWQDFLRIAWLDTTSIDMIAIMSDGCADLVIEGAKRPMTIYRPFFANLVFNLCAMDDVNQGSQIIEQALANPATYRLTGDDKTLAVLIKQPYPYRGFEPLMQTASDSQAPATATSSVWHGGTQPSLSTDVSDTSIDTSTSVLTQPISTSQRAPSPQEIDTPASTTHLPPTAPITDSGKQRRNTAIMAGLAAIVGAGTLVWLNQDKLLSNTPATVATTPVNASEPLPTINALIPVTLDEPANVTLTASAANAKPTFDVVLAIPTDSQNQALVAVTPMNAPLALSVPKVAASATASTNQSSASQSTWATALQEPANITCQPVTSTDFNALSQLGIAVDKTWQYQRCQVALSSAEITKINQVQLSQGLTSLIQVKPRRSNVASATAAASQVASSAVPTGDAAQIQLYYLPVVSMPALTSNASAASRVAVTASTAS